MSKPVYDFLGFRLLSANYNRSMGKPVESIELKIMKSSFSPEDHIYSLLLSLKMICQNEDTSSFVFASGFLINEVAWKDSFAEGVLDSLFVSVVFPYIRQKIHAITDDTSGAIDLPILDLRGANLIDGAIFTIRKGKKSAIKPTKGVTSE